jgi:sugar-specific transcriptional regulator TrmB
MDAIVEQLRQVGFSLYEARLYAALLRHGPQNGNELSRSSGVPSSKVYATVEKLVAEGSVQRIASPGGTRFVALAPDELVDRLRRRFNDPLDYLAETLPPLADQVEDEVFLSISGENTILESARRLVSAAREELHISLGEHELDGLRTNIDEAAERGVRIFGMLYSATADEPAGTWLRHSYEEIVGNRVGGRMLTLVADGAEALVARLRDRGGADGVRTRNPVLTLIVSEYLHHDLVLQRAQIDIGFDEWDRWWLADPELRGQILGRAFDRSARATAPAA